MNIGEIQDELLRSEYPYLLPNHDPDIERYYYLRSTGQPEDALRIFQSRLRIRYPNDEFRTALLRSYRSRDPAFRLLMGAAYRALGERSLERIRRAINYIVDKADHYNRRDVYSTIRAAEDIMQLLPRDRFEAVAAIERFLRYAQAMDFKVKSMMKAVELIRAYLTQSLSVAENEKRRRERRRRREEEETRRFKLRFGGPVIDFSSVVFSPGDLSRIEIPENITRIEDQILAFCVKYWNQIDDPAFERILFLYSRKHGTKHYDVFLAIRRSRMAKRRDDEILSAVMSALVSGYYYSIRGDRYLQIRWNIIKAQMNSPEALLAPGARGVKTEDGEGGGEKIEKAEDGGDGASSGAVKAAAGRKPSPRRKPARKKPARRKTEKKTAVRPGKTAAAKRPAEGGEDLETRKAPARRRRKFRTVPAPAGGSVSDRLQELSGRSYDLYRERFLSHVRPSIRKILGAGRGIFFNPPERAEDLIFDFLKGHYSDPYMNWAESADRKALAEMGFELPSLYPVIDECYRRLEG
ncbi:MAG: hypothetical protein LBG42_05345 [Treponema sp.]|jgi:hypothetical protein|nr:hypothetical protein [Treponema sp.]